MRRSLIRHPDSPHAAIHVDVEVTRPRAGTLVLSYRVSGDMLAIRMPPPVPAARKDELWRHTCFEAFIGSSSDTAYYEFNIAPSTEWAVYSFTGYRKGMRVADEIAALPIDGRSRPDAYVLQASLDVDRLCLPRIFPWRLALSAVIEDAGGSVSYWALAHPPGKPDFHHAACFAHELSPAELT